MKRLLIIIIIFISLFSSCKDRGTVIYRDGPPPFNDTTKTMVSIVGEDGKLIHFFNKRFFSLNNIKLVGSDVNDSIYYLFDTKEDSLKIITTVFKSSYKKPLFIIEINNDTVEIGQEFTGSIHLMNKSISIDLDKENEYKKTVVKNKFKNTFRYVYKPNALGHNKFKGTLEIDRSLIPFEYNFIVIYPSKGDSF
jgi:hypothetical protein